MSNFFFRSDNLIVRSEASTTFPGPSTTVRYAESLASQGPGANDDGGTNWLGLSDRFSRV
jgi:hypothetical protein